MRFEWDDNNPRHIISDYPERENTVDEVESVFKDANLLIKLGKEDLHEQRFGAVGMGNSQNIKYVIFTIHNGRIRPISCWPANRQNIRYYYENIRSK